MNKTVINKNKDQAGRDLGSRAMRTRQKFLDATAKLLEERSVLDISVTEIARQVDSVSSLFYHYFKDVEDAAQQLAQEAMIESVLVRDPSRPTTRKMFLKPFLGSRRCIGI